MKISTKTLAKIILLLLLYWLPFISIFWYYTPHTKIETLAVSDAVVVFGTLVRDDTVSALLKERLDASIAIFNAKKAKTIVLSNTKEATLVMQKYLIEQKIPLENISLDVGADKTPDTCRYEKEMFSDTRKLIFVSQGYHLPRISYQCQKMGINAVLYPAETIQKKRATLFSSWRVFSIRTQRYFREAGLTLLAILGIYQ